MSLTSSASLGASPRWLVHLKLLGMAVLWGASWPAGRVIAQSLPPLASSAWRFGLAVLLFLLWCRLAQGGLGSLRRLSGRQWLGLSAAGAVGVFGYAFFFMLGLQEVPAGRAALIVTVNPVFTALIAAWWFGERFNGAIAAGMAAALLGAVVVLTDGRPDTLWSGGIGHGEWLLIGCAACWVAYTLMARRLLAGIAALTTTTVTAGAGGLLLLLGALAFEGTAALAAPLSATPPVWVALAFLAVGSTVLAYAWYFEGVAALGAGGAAAYISLVPVFGVATSALLLGESLDAPLMIGGALAVGGMLVMNRARR